MENVRYLEIEDFTPDGNLKSYVNQGRPAVIMAQGDFCGYCTQAKPAFQKFASESKVIACTIKIDGDASEKEAAKFLKKWDSSYRGVPHYTGFDSSGRMLKIHTGNRDFNSITKFASSLN